MDAGVVESADGRIPWSRFEALVAAKVAQAAPALAREKEERAAKATFAKKLRGEAHGMATWMVRADVATIEAIDAAVTASAEVLTETMPDADLDTRRVHAVLLLANPGAETGTDLADLLPTVQLYLHAYTGPDAEPVARLEGHGPVTQAWVTRVLGPRCRFRIQPVFDLAGQAPVDAYEIPERHRQAVHLMTPADTFPFATSLSRNNRSTTPSPHDQGGESRVGNYGPMTTRHHRIKTHGRLAGPATLPRHLRLARPPRRLLPRRPHRHPPPTRHGKTEAAGHRDLPQLDPDRLHRRLTGAGTRDRDTRRPRWSSARLERDARRDQPGHQVVPHRLGGGHAP